MQTTTRAMDTAAGDELSADVEYDYSAQDRGHMVRLADTTSLPSRANWLTAAEARQLARFLLELADEADEADENRN